MTSDEFEVALRRWGWVYGERSERELPENARAPAVHPIARAVEFGHRSMDKRQSIAYHRTLRPGERTWSRDPIVCTETRAAVGAPPVAPSRADIAPVIQSAWLELRRTDEALAEALRLEYQARDKQSDKAKTMGIGRGKFREMAAEAKGRVYATVMMRLAS